MPEMTYPKFACIGLEVKSDGIPEFLEYFRGVIDDKYIDSLNPKIRLARCKPGNSTHHVCFASSSEVSPQQIPSGARMVLARLRKRHPSKNFICLPLLWKQYKKVKKIIEALAQIPLE